MPNVGPRFDSNYARVCNRKEVDMGYLAYEKARDPTRQPFYPKNEKALCYKI